MACSGSRRSSSTRSSTCRSSSSSSSRSTRTGSRRSGPASRSTGSGSPSTDPIVTKALGNSATIAFINAILATLFGTMAALGLQRVGKRTRMGYDVLTYVSIIVPGDRDRPRDAGLLRLDVRRHQPDPGQPPGRRQERLQAQLRPVHDHRRPRPVQPEPRPAAGARPAVRAWTGPWWRPARTCSRPRGGRSARSPSRSSCRRSWPGFLLAFTFSFDDYVITSFVTGPGSTTLPIFIFGQVKRGVSPETNAIATMVLALTIGMLLIGQAAPDLAGPAQRRPQQLDDLHRRRVLTARWRDQPDFPIDDVDGWRGPTASQATGLTLAAARAIIDAVQATARTLGVAMSCAVVDAGRSTGGVRADGCGRPRRDHPGPRQGLHRAREPDADAGPRADRPARHRVLRVRLHRGRPDDRLRRRHAARTRRRSWSGPSGSVAATPPRISRRSRLASGPSAGRSRQLRLGQAGVGRQQGGLVGPLPRQVQVRAVRSGRRPRSGGRSADAGRARR